MYPSVAALVYLAVVLARTLPAISAPATTGIATNVSYLSPHIGITIGSSSTASPIPTENASLQTVMTALLPFPKLPVCTSEKGFVKALENTQILVHTLDEEDGNGSENGALSFSALKGFGSIRGHTIGIGKHVVDLLRVQFAPPVLEGLM
jgi:hypothetical protein